MSSNSHEGGSESSTTTDTSSKNGRAPSQTTIFFPNPANAPPKSDSADTCRSRLACPVSSCSSVFSGGKAHRDFWRHLKHPNPCGTTGDEGAAWLNLHEMEHERLLHALEDNRAEEERNLRTAEFELRARNMGITGERSVAEKVAIWEGMLAAQQAGNDIQYDAGILLDAATGADQ
ncbi:hypothetical protein HOY80DRAFT_1106725 [Tuber brumale]|nr:hypothetical protein HOY80DRAFT_1106725 [Tuber brumale]